jgi:hypothetical protein
MDEIKFVLLTETDYKEYMKLKERKQKNNEYHNAYEKRKYEKIKKSNPEEYERLIKKQNEYNKTYKNKHLIKIKQDPILYEEFKKQERERKEERERTKLINKLKLLNYIAAT